jgi:hypothetical protein
MLLTGQQTEEVTTEPPQQADGVETLRQIIARQELREVGYDEAHEIGNSLLEFYEILAEEVCDETSD